MAGNRVVIKFIGEDGSLKKSLAELETRASRIRDRFGKTGDAIGKVLKPLALLGAAGNAIKTLNGVAAAGQQLLPIALLLPAALLGGAAAMATFKLATAGFADALGGDADAMAKLAPNARATVQALQGLKPQFETLRKSVQDQFFRGFADDVRALGADYLPVLQSRLPAMAVGFNAWGRSLAFALHQQSSIEGVRTILTNTTSTLINMRNAAGHVATGFIALGGAGSKYLPVLGRLIDGATDKFRFWSLQLVESGRFDVLVGSAKAGFSDLFKVIGNVGSVLGSVWKGLSGGSGASSPLATLRDMTGALREFFTSAAAQGPLQALGQTMSTLGGVLRDVVVAALKALAPIVQSLAPIVSTLGKAVGSILVAAFEQLGPPLQKLIDKLNPLLQRLLPWIATVITGVVIPALAKFIDWISSNIDSIEDFAQKTVIAFLEAGQSVLGFVSFTLGAMSKVFAVLGTLPGQFGANMRAAAVSTNGAKTSVDQLRGTVDQLHSKAIGIQAQTQGLREVQDLVRTIGLLPAVKTVVVNAQASIASSIRGTLGFRAQGGPVNAGASYVVGEHGPEVVTMGSSGYVTSNTRLGGGSSSAPTVTFAGNTADAVASMFMQLIREKKIILT